MLEKNKSGVRWMGLGRKETVMWMDLGNLAVGKPAGPLSWSPDEVDQGDRSQEIASNFLAAKANQDLLKACMFSSESS